MSHHCIQYKALPIAPARHTDLVISNCWIFVHAAMASLIQPHPDGLMVWSGAGFLVPARRCVKGGGCRISKTTNHFLQKSKSYAYCFFIFWLICFPKSCKVRKKFRFLRIHKKHFMRFWEKKVENPARGASFCKSQNQNQKTYAYTLFTKAKYYFTKRFRMFLRSCFIFLNRLLFLNLS